MPRVAVLSLDHFLITTAILQRRPVPMSPRLRLELISTLIEAIVLAEEVRFHGAGAFQQEWRNGGRLGIEDRGWHPYKPFHDIPFILPAEGYAKGSGSFEMIRQREREDIAKDSLGSDYRQMPVWSQLVIAVMSLNGTFLHRSDVLSSPLTEPFFHRVIQRVDCASPRTQDMVGTAYGELKNNYADALRSVDLADIPRATAPPLTAAVLNQLPDDCCDPGDLLRIAWELRNRCEGYRARWTELESAYYDGSLMGQRRIKRALTVDAESIARHCNTAPGTASVRWYFEPVCFLIRAIAAKVSLDDVLDFAGRYLPPIGEWISLRRPSVLYRVARDTTFIREHASLVKRKLGFDPVAPAE